MAASLLDIKGNKAIKQKFVFLANWLGFPNTVTYVVLDILKMQNCRAVFSPTLFSNPRFTPDFIDYIIAKLAYIIYYTKH